MGGNAQRRKSAKSQKSSKDAPPTGTQRFLRFVKRFWGVFVVLATVLGVWAGVDQLARNATDSAAEPAPATTPSAPSATEQIIYIPPMSLVDDKEEVEPDDIGFTCSHDSIVSIRVDAHLCTSIAFVKDPCFVVTADWVACPRDGNDKEGGPWILKGFVDYAFEDPNLEKVSLDQADEQAYPWSIAISQPGEPDTVCMMDWATTGEVDRFREPTYYCGTGIDALVDQQAFIEGQDGALRFTLPGFARTAIAFDRSHPVWTVRLQSDDGSSYETTPIAKAWF